ncbi:MAG: hypothetical protein LBU88_06970 [Treponema sp.]|jgi:type II secretory pathway pseudopilin PulG|nr:hypothetical protein [Treponema sp.]
MKNTENAFTLMETLLTVAIVLIISGVFVVASGSALKGASQSFKAIGTANTLKNIDHFIRNKTNETHIPYWAHNITYIDTLKAQLYQSKYGKYIKSINIVSRNQKAPRGIEVIYEVNNHEMRTIALFPSIAVLDTIK